MVSIATTNTTPIRVALTNDFDLVALASPSCWRLPRSCARSSTPRCVATTSTDGSTSRSSTRSPTTAATSRRSVGCSATRPPRVALFTWQFDPTLVDRALSIGVTGYLSKALGAKELVDALESVASGRQTISPDPASDRHSASERDWPGRRDGISERESEVLILIAEGLSNKQIVECLDISPNSVRPTSATCTGARRRHPSPGISRRARSGNGPLRRQSLTRRTSRAMSSLPRAQRQLRGDLVTEPDRDLVGRTGVVAGAPDDVLDLLDVEPERRREVGHAVRVEHERVVGPQLVGGRHEVRTVEDADQRTRTAQALRRAVRPPHHGKRMTSCGHGDAEATVDPVQLAEEGGAEGVAVGSQHGVVQLRERLGRRRSRPGRRGRIVCRASPVIAAACGPVPHTSPITTAQWSPTAKAS